MTSDTQAYLELGGFVLVVETIMANAYWQDAVRWDNVVYQAAKRNREDLVMIAVKRVRYAKAIFRQSTFLGFLVGLGIALPLVGGDHSCVALISRGLISIAMLLVLAVLALLTVLPRYLVPIETSDILLELDRSP